MRKIQNHFYRVIFFWMVISSLPSIAQISAVNEQPVTELYQIITGYDADRGSLFRFYTIRSSPERRERFEEFYKSYLANLQQFDFSQLSLGGQVDYILFKRDLENELVGLQQEENEYEAIRDWVKIGDPLYEVERLRRRGKKLDGQEIAGQLFSLNEALESEGKKVKDDPDVSRLLIRRAQDVIRGQREALKSVFEFYKDYDPAFTWWVQKPYGNLDTALMKYSKLLDTKVDSATLPEDDGSGIIGFPIGREEVTRLMEYEMIPYTPDELVDIANKEFAWCDRELLRASREMGFGDNWQAAQEKVKNSYVPPGYQPEAMYELYNQSIEFLKEHDLISIPPLAEETWRMGMIPPERQLISPFFLGGELLQISYPTDEMDHDDKLMSMRGNNPHFSRSTVHHELIAGHHLQGFMNRRHKPYREFRTPFWTEGWALYWELLLWDLGFPRGPEDRIGMLFWRMHRCARIIFSLNYHLGHWSPQQCIDFLVERVGHERANAEGEVRRSFTSNYGPLYQLAYMTGGLQFWALKEELVDSGKMSFKDFHDAVMKENAMPVEMVRAILTNQKLSNDHKSEWKFYK